MTNKTTSAIDLVERLKCLLPVSWDNETDGHGEPTHAVLTFGEHQTQAITLCPDDWMVLNEIPDTITRLQAALDDMRQQGQAEGFAAAVQWLRDRSAIKPPATLWHAASLLADQMERSNRPCSSVGGE